MAALIEEKTLNLYPFQSAGPYRPALTDHPCAN